MHPPVTGAALLASLRTAAKVETARALTRTAREGEELLEIGLSLSSERDLPTLQRLIVHKARELTGADAGSLFVIEDRDGERRLRFAVAQTGPKDDGVLMDFYKRVNPWGFWGPIRDKVMREDPSFRPNPDFTRDMFNILVGIAWQTSLIAFPVYIVIRRYEIAAWAIAVVVVTSLILKFTWYDHLKKMEIEPAPGGRALARAGL